MASLHGFRDAFNIIYLTIDEYTSSLLLVDET